jgi:hypothetical protein
MQGGHLWQAAALEANDGVELGIAPASRVPHRMVLLKETYSRYPNGGMRLHSRTSDLVAWAKTMFPVVHQSIRYARTQLGTGHDDIRTYTLTRQRQNQP